MPSASNLPVTCKSSFVVAYEFVPDKSPIWVFPPAPGRITRSSLREVVMSTGTPSNSSVPARAGYTPIKVKTLIANTNVNNFFMTGLLSNAKRLLKLCKITLVTKFQKTSLVTKFRKTSLVTNVYFLCLLKRDFHFPSLASLYNASKYRSI